jgi:hypothetical protein
MRTVRRRIYAAHLTVCRGIIEQLEQVEIDAFPTAFVTESSKSIPRVKSLLAALLITSAAQLVPVFLFDGSYHFGALWSFALPALLFVTPTKGGDTVVMIICDTLFAQVGEVLRSVVPEALQVSEVEVWDSKGPFPRRLPQDDQGSQLVLIGGVLIALLL